MIVTMLNLLPVGMLDGGHIARCIAGNKDQACTFSPLDSIAIFRRLLAHGHTSPISGFKGTSRPLG
jgi:membrane-associated protease RseP (regulator of RpoE activity)